MYLTVIAGVGGAIGLYWIISRRKKAAPAHPLTVDTGSAGKEPADSTSPESPMFSDIMDMLSRVTLEASPDLQVLQQLTSMLSSLSESELNEIKLSSDYVSFMVSEWVFYHTLRTNKSVTWNSNTGLIDQVLSPRERDLGNRIASTMRRAYWDKHLEDLSGVSPNYLHVVDRLAELELRMNEYRKNRKSDIFDLDLVKQLIDHGQFDFPFFVSLVKRAVAAMHELESPAAHEETLKFFDRIQSLKVESRKSFHYEIIEALKFLFSQLDVLEAELANFKSSQLALESKRKKERQLFSNLLSENLISCEKLRRILASEVSLESRSNYGSLTSAIVSAIKHVVLRATESSGPKNLPESMNPDSSVIDSFCQRRTNLSLVAAFLVGFHAQLTSIIGESGIVFLRQDAEVINRLISEFPEAANRGGFPAVLELLIDAIEAFMGKPLQKIQKEQLSDCLEKCCSDSSQLRILLNRKVSSLIEYGIKDSTSSALASTALGSRPWFLSVCANETSRLIKDMLEFIAEHLHVYLPVYRDIVTSSLQ